jgi:hypothetical protein
MKKVLLGTSAMAMAGALATTASAAEWNVRVGGYYNAMVAYAQTDINSDADYDGVDVSTNAEIFFLPSITLDNGIKIGANIQLEAESGSDQIDESYVYISGSFGEILIGSENSAGYKMTYGAPNAAIIALNSPSTPDYIAWTENADSVFRGTLGSTFVEVNGNNDAKRITYFTPRFSGFQIGASYARDGNQDNWGPSDLNSGSQIGNIFDIGANYVQSFGDLSIAVSGRYGTGEHGSYNPTVWSAGINVGYGGFTIGGSFAESNEHNQGTDDGTAYDIGASYAMGPWKFSLTYFHGENGEGGGTSDEQDTFGGAVNYQLAKGVRLNAFGAYVDYDAGNCSCEDVSGFVIGTGIGLSF